jgi:hypothetical protein
VKNIHACRNDCILYRGPEYEDLVDSADSIIKKMTMIMRTATEIEEKTGLKGVLILSYHSLFEALFCKQGVKIITVAQKEP